ncbi:MAG: FHA domain-containing protein [Candidatus Omnitrophota bacterium]
MKMLRLKSSVIFVLWVAVCSVGHLLAAENNRVKDIKNYAYHYSREVVKVEGKVIRLCSDEKPSSTTRGYFFQDDFGDEIKVVTLDGYPEVDKHYRITGMVVVNITDTDKAEVNIVEHHRDVLSNSPEVKQPADNGQQQTQFKEPKNNSKFLILFIAILIVFVLIAVFVYIKINNNKKKGDIHDSQESSLFPGSLDSDTNEYPEPDSFIEDLTIKMSAPPPGTLKLLPGRLEMIAGYDKVKEIRFYKLPTQEETEFSFGRSPGPNYIHIQFKSPTVSSKQAKLIWTNKKYMILNYSTTNPTKVDDVVMEKDQSLPIGEGTKIEMGEVAFIFHDK